MYRISVETVYAGFVHVGAGHLYLVFRSEGEQDGDGMVVRAGPFGSYILAGIADINVAPEEYGSTDTEQTRHAYDILSTSSLADYNGYQSLITSYVASINSAEFGYKALGPNSNSFVASILSLLNINVYEYLVNTDVLSEFWDIPGMDYIISGDRDDTLRGFEGSDIFYDKGGNDKFTGGDDSDISTGILIDTTDGIDTVDYSYAGIPPNISVVTVSDTKMTATDGWGGTDELNSIEIVKGKFGSSTSFESYSSSINAQFIASELGTTVTTSSGAQLQFINFADITGSSQNDIMQVLDDEDITQSVSFHGGRGVDILTGGFSADHLFGDAGNDTLSGGNGDDEIQGGTGWDTLIGGAGNDILDGGSSADGSWESDTADYSGEEKKITVTVDDAGIETVAIDEGAGGTDTILNIERIVGSAYDDTISVLSKAIVFDGKAGVDHFDASLSPLSVQVNLSNTPNAEGIIGPRSC